MVTTFESVSNKMHKVACITRKPRITNIKPSRRSQNLRLPTYVHKPIFKNNHSNVVCQSSDTVEALTVASYYIGKSIILFTMFYSGLNYYNYKRLREEAEKDDDKKSNNSKNNKKTEK